MPAVSSSVDPGSSAPGAPPRGLVITRCGRESVHRRWLEPSASRDFDVWLSWFEKEGTTSPGASERGAGVHEELRPGANIAGLGRLLRERAAELARYDHIALLDDDIETDARDLSRLFELARAGRFRICQPSLTHDSHHSHPIFLRHPSLSVRYVNFIEVMCPIFRRDVLLECLPLFEQGLEVGLDLVWCHLPGADVHDHAVFDDVAVRHGRPIGLRKTENGFADGRDYPDDIALARVRHGLTKVPGVVFSAVDRRGRTLDSATPWGRARLLLAALPVVRATWLTSPFRWLLRGVLAYWWRTLFLPRRLRQVIVAGPSFDGVVAGAPIESRASCVPIGTERPRETDGAVAIGTDR